MDFLSSPIPGEGNILQISGIPTESATRRLTISVSDSSSDSYSQDFWLTVEPSQVVIPTPDKAPRVVAMGFDGAYVIKNQASTVTFRAWVVDSDNNTLCVKVYDQSGNYMGPLFPDGTPNRFSGQFNITALAQGSYFFKMYAMDAQNHVSHMPAPYMVIDGGPGEGNPSFVAESTQTAQTAATTPRIDRVELPPHSIPAAETDHLTGRQLVRVYIKSIPTGTTVSKVEVKIKHNIPGVVLPVLTLTATSDPMIYQGTFNAQAGWFGWGYYSVNAQVTVSTGSTTYVSDWWPRLRAH